MAFTIALFQKSTKREPVAGAGRKSHDGLSYGARRVRIKAARLVRGSYAKVILCGIAARFLRRNHAGRSRQTESISRAVRGRVGSGHERRSGAYRGQIGTIQSHG